MKVWRLIIVSACATAGLTSMALERNWADMLWPVLATAFYWAYCVQRERAESAERIKANDVVDRYMRIKDQITVTRDGEGGE